MHVPLTESSSAAKANTATINSGSKAGWVSLAATRFKQSVSRRRSPFLEAAARFKAGSRKASGAGVGTLEVAARFKAGLKTKPALNRTTRSAGNVDEAKTEELIQHVEAGLLTTGPSSARASPTEVHQLREKWAGSQAPPQTALHQQGIPRNDDGDSSTTSNGSPARQRQRRNSVGQALGRVAGLVEGMVGGDTQQQAGPGDPSSAQERQTESHQHGGASRGNDRGGSLASPERKRRNSLGHALGRVADLVEGKSHHHRSGTSSPKPWARLKHTSSSSSFEDPETPKTPHRSGWVIGPALTDFPSE